MTQCSSTCPHARRYCQLCISGYYKGVGGACEPCAEAEYLYYFAPFGAALVAVLACLLTLRYSETCREHAAAAMAILKRRRFLSPPTMITIKVALRSSLAFVQVTLLLERVFAVVLPDNFARYLEPFRILSFDRMCAQQAAQHGGWHPRVPWPHSPACLTGPLPTPSLVSFAATCTA